MFNRIMVHNVKYNGLTFLNAPYFRKEWWFLCLKEFSFFEVATSASTEKYAIMHGEYVSPTLKKNRRVRILFDILANTEKERRALLRRVQRAFNPEANPSPFNKNLWKKLEFEDVDWNIWTANCQVIKGVELSDFAYEKWCWISVELITDSPEFTSSELQTLTWGRNTRFGKKLWTELPFNWEYYREKITYDWVIDAPMKITLTVVKWNSCPNGDILLMHEYEWGYEWLRIEDISELGLTIWSKIFIDTQRRKVLFIKGENVEDITWLVSLWSQRPLLHLWDNIISVDTWAVFKTINVDIERNEIF